MASFLSKTVSQRFRLRARLTTSFLAIALATAPAITAIEPALAATPKENWSVSGAFLAGIIAKETGDMGTASDLLPIALEASPENAGLLQTTLIALISAGRVDEGIRLARRLTKEKPSLKTEAPLSMMLLIQGEIKDGKYEEALALARQLPDQQVGKYAGPMLRAWLVAASKKQVDAAVKELQPLESLEGFAPFALMQRGAIEDFLQKPQEAQKSYQSAADSASELPTLLVQAYGNFLQRRGDKAALDQLIDRFQTENTGRNDSIAGPLIQSLKRPGKPKPIINSAKEGIAQVLSGMTILLLQENITGEALLFGRLGLDLMPDLEMAKILIGDIYRRTDHLDDAVAMYRTIGKDSIYRWSADLSVAECLRRQDKIDEAEKLLRQMVGRDKKNVEAAVLLGDLLRGANRFEAAAAAYSTAIERIGTPMPNDWSVFYFRGTSYERAKQWPKAEADFKKALELSPDQPYVLNYLAYSWVERRENLDQALKMLESAVNQRPEEGFIVDSLGWAHYQLGDFADAVKYLERAVELSPQDPTLNDHLGDAYWRAGRFNEARFQWSRALSFKPEPDQAKQIETKIRDGLPEKGDKAGDKSNNGNSSGTDKEARGEKAG
jgi:tetratricopeptide (TPR) repeat protein